MNFFFSRIRPTLPIIAGMILLSGCANTALVIETYYGRLDTRLVRDFKKYADFDDEQTTWIEDSVSGFMVWHRSIQLPIYSDYILRMRDRVVLNQDVVEQDITWMMNRFLDIVDLGFERFPFLKSVDLMQGLSDDQVSQVSRQTDKEYKKYRKKFEARRRNYRDKRVERVSSILKRVGLDLTDGQRQIIADGLSERHGDYEENLEVWYSWAKRLIVTLEDRDLPGFYDEATRQIAQYPRLMQIYRPEDWQHNYEVDRNTLLRLFRDLDSMQREGFAEELTSLSELLGEMAGREPAAG